MEKAGLDCTAVYEANSGKKTREVNAYESGLFLGRRIVLYGVLAEKADPSEVEFVVAHEIGHWKKNHILKGIALATGGAAAILYLLGKLLRLTARLTKQEKGAHYGPASVPVFFFWLEVILLLVMPVECAISRRFEAATDNYALGLTQNPEGAIRLFQKAARRNLLDLNPPPLAKLWLHTHPTIPERIQAALRGTKGRPARTPSGPSIPRSKRRSSPEPGSPTSPALP